MVRQYCLLGATTPIAALQADLFDFQFPYLDKDFSHTGNCPRHSPNRFRNLLGRLEAAKIKLPENRRL